MKLLGHSLTIWDLAFIRQIWRSVLSRMSFPPLLRHGLPEYSTQCPVDWVFTVWLWAAASISGPGWMQSTILSIFQMGLSWPQVAPWYACTDKYSAEYSRGSLCRSPGFSLWAVLPFPALCSENSTLLGLSRLSATSPRLRLHLGPLIWTEAWTVSWGDLRAPFICFSCLLGIIIL